MNVFNVTSDRIKASLLNYSISQPVVLSKSMNMILKHSASMKAVCMCL